MQVFNVTINQMLVFFCFMLVGFLLNKSGALPKDTSKVLSKLETYLLLPCLTFQTFYNNCTITNFVATGKFVIYGAIVLACSFALALLLSRIFTKDKYTKSVYIYSFTIPNLGFMGNALVEGVFGSEVLFQYMMFYFSMQIFIYTYGLYSLIPKEAGAKFSLKSLLSPPLIAMLIGAIFGMLEIPLPEFLSKGIASAGSAMSPIAMVIAGFVFGNYGLKKLASNGRVYIATAIRLILMPIAFTLVLKALGTSEDIIIVVLCATALPFGLNTIVFPEAYGGDSTVGASMAMISHFLSVITIPLVFLLLL